MNTQLETLTNLNNDMNSTTTTMDMDNMDVHAPLSPALSVASSISDMTDEELDKYFATYVPLSNLPTPPPAKDPIVLVDAAPSALPPSPILPSYLVDGDVAYQSPELEVYATHLANLVPTNASPTRSNLPIVRGFLSRANLPVEIIAFAACILDALSLRFASSWRTCMTPDLGKRQGHGQSSPLPTSSQFHLTHQHSQPSSSCSSPSPELVVLAALALAHDFIDDRCRSTRHWSLVEARSLFDVSQIDATKFVILKDMDFGLFRITAEMVDEVVRDFKTVVDELPSAIVRSSGVKKVVAGQVDCCVDAGDKVQMLVGGPGLLHGGAAVWVHGVQTPEPSP